MSRRRVDPRSDRAQYRQLADILRDMIKTGRLAFGDLLPSEAHLGQDYAVGRDTVRDALAVLRGEGLIETISGVGSRVRQPKETRTITPEPGSRVTTRMPTDAERRRLGIAQGVPVFVVEHAGETRIYPGDSTIMEVP